MEREPLVPEGRVLSRREFLKFAGIAGATIGAGAGLGGLLAACGGTTTTTTAATTATTAAPAQTTTTTAAPATTTTSAAPATTVTTAAAGPAKTYTIGAILSQSGVMAAAFNAFGEAVPLVEQLLNSKGGFTVNGQAYNVKIAVEDDMSTTDGAISAAKKLMGAGITQISAPQFIPNNAAIAGVCEESKLLRLVPIGPNLKEYAAPAKYCFAAISTAIGANPTLDKTFQLYPNVKKIAVVALDDPGIQDIVGRAKTYFLAHGMEITLDEQFPADTQDYYPVMTKALATKPDAIAGIGGAPPFAKGLMESMRQMGFTGPMISSANWGDPVVLSKLIDPKYDTDFPNQIPDSTSDLMPQIVKDLKALSDSKGMTMQLDYTAMLAPISTIVQAIQKAQSFDNDALVSAMETMDFDTIWGPGKMGGAKDVAGVNIGQNRMMVTPVPFTRLMNGKIEFEWLPAPTIAS
jgi:ABC-type branched-subunit amino acid transport system substrate-binding protein